MEHTAEVCGAAPGHVAQASRQGHAGATVQEWQGLEPLSPCRHHPAGTERRSSAQPVFQLILRKCDILCTHRGSALDPPDLKAVRREFHKAAGWLYSALPAGDPFLPSIPRRMTYRTRRCLSPLKAPSAMWLMELWLRRSVLRLLRSARLSSSSRVRLLKDKTLGEASKCHCRVPNTGTPCPLLNIEPQSAGSRWDDGTLAGSPESQGPEGSCS